MPLSSSSTEELAQANNIRPQNPHELLSQAEETRGAVTSASVGHESGISSKYPKSRPWTYGVAGAAGAMTSSILTSPLDVLKTRLQSEFYQSQLIATRQARAIPPPSAMSLSNSLLLHVRETFQILFSIHRVEGWRALFKGLGPSLTGTVPARATHFWAYGNGKRLISHKFNNGHEAAWVHCLAAANAGIITSTITNPIWLVKTRLQLDKNRAEKFGSSSTRQYRNSWDCIRQTLRSEGVKGLYKGLSSSYLGVSEPVLQWMLYEQIKIRLRERKRFFTTTEKKSSLWNSTVDLGGKFTGAGVAKFFAALATYPHEVVRTRLRQAPQANGIPKYTGLIQCFKTIWKEEGVASFYGGLTPHMLRTVPGGAIQFGIYELVIRFFGEKA